MNKDVKGNTFKLLNNFGVDNEIVSPATDKRCIIDKLLNLGIIQFSRLILIVFEIEKMESMKELRMKK